MPKYRVRWRGRENGKQVVHIHGKYGTLEEARTSIFEWWEKNNFRPPYIREWQEERTRGGIKTIIDYGSHCNFYEIWEVEK
ncbi:MAG: hypothetical protein SPI35_07980 [Porphyromonas sp.]|nr:hypothetical protein [Porphyromonas sp.]